jgi:hypothetical protein
MAASASDGSEALTTAWDLTPLLDNAMLSRIQTSPTSKLTWSTRDINCDNAAGSQKAIAIRYQALSIPGVW